MTVLAYALWAGLGAVVAVCALTMLLAARPSWLSRWSA